MLGILRIINDQVFHHRAKLEAHSIEAHGLDLKMEQVKLDENTTLTLASPLGVPSMQPDHPLVGRLHSTPCN